MSTNTTRVTPAAMPRQASRPTFSPPAKTGPGTKPAARTPTRRQRRLKSLHPLLRDKPLVKVTKLKGMPPVVVYGVIDQVDRHLGPQIVDHSNGTYATTTMVHLRQATLPMIDLDDPDRYHMAIAQHINHRRDDRLTVQFMVPVDPAPGSGLTLDQLQAGMYVRTEVSLATTPLVRTIGPVTSEFHEIASTQVTQARIDTGLGDDVAYTPRDCALMTETLAMLYANDLGVQALQAIGPGTGAETSHRLAGIFADRTTMTVFADEAFTSSMIDMAGAPNAPSAPLRPAEILTTRAIYYFQRCLLFSDILATLAPSSPLPPPSQNLPVRALSWHPDPTPYASAAGTIMTLWVAAADTRALPASMRKELGPALVPVLSVPLTVVADPNDSEVPAEWSHARTDIDVDDPAHHSVAHALIRSITHLSRMEVSTYRTEIPTVPKEAPEPEVDELTGPETRTQRRKRLAAHQRRRDEATRVRVLRLRHPGHQNGNGAGEERGAAGGNTDEAGKRVPVMRQHWVAGFWRKQYYASEKIHRYIWIDSHLRGDASLGFVTAPKVHTVTSPA